MRFIHLRRFTVLVLLLLFVPAASLARGEATPFSVQDVSVNAAAAGAAMDDVRSTLGNPVSEQTETVAATGDTADTWRYENLTLVFTNGNLSHADWTDATRIGPRGLKIGDSRDAVLQAFYRDPAQTDSGVLYTAGYVETFKSQLPPCGLIQQGADGATEIVYRAPLEPYSADVLADPAQYVYCAHASLYFTIDSATDMVTRIQWDIGALAE